LPEVGVTARLAATPAHVWRILSDMEAFPRFMNSVEQVRVVERGDGYTVTEWVARLQGMRFRWTERDDFDPGAGTITYRQVAGDLRRFEGAWTVTPAPGDAEAADGRTTVTLNAIFDFGLPMLSAMLDPVGKVVLRRNVETMLKGLEDELGRTGDDS